jgi:hypothetical protein
MTASSAGRRPPALPIEQCFTNATWLGCAAPARDATSPPEANRWIEAKPLQPRPTPPGHRNGPTLRTVLARNDRTRHDRARGDRSRHDRAVVQLGLNNLVILQSPAVDDDAPPRHRAMIRGSDAASLGSRGSRRRTHSRSSRRSVIRRTRVRARVSVLRPSAYSSPATERRPDRRRGGRLRSRSSITGVLFCGHRASCIRGATSRDPDPHTAADLHRRWRHRPALLLALPRLP